MAWTLKCGDQKLVIDGTREAGRADFPKVPALSRKHFEFSERQGKLFIKDLGSRNGTFLNGNRLEPGFAVEMRPGDVIKVRTAEFHAEPAVVRARVQLHGSAAIDAALLAL